MSTTLYTVVSEPLKATTVDVGSLRKALEKGSDDDRIRAMHQIVARTIAGDNLQNLLMDVIRFVLPSKSKPLKKLLHTYWEVVPKHDDQGKMCHEMILVVNAIRNDLQHPNEYIRGGTLRFLTKFREAELLEPLIPAIRQCLEHRHAYVRKNAVFCVLAIAQYEATQHLVPDAAELLAQLLDGETDSTCRRNAFVALTRLDRSLAYASFHAQYANIADCNEMLQLALVGFAARDSVVTPELAPTYTKILQDWLTQAQESTLSLAVMYEVATTLANLTDDPVILNDAAAAFIEIAVKESDTNIKINALGRVGALADDDTLAQQVMDVLLVLPSQDLGVRRAALKLALKLVTNRTVDQVLRLLRKELANSFGKKYDTVDDYRHAIIDTIHELALRFRETTNEVVSLLLEFLGELSATTALEVVSFVKEVVEQHSDQRGPVMLLLADALPSIRSARVYLSALWVLGEYSTTEEQIMRTWQALREAMGPVPFNKSESVEASSEEVESSASTKPRVLADGTYATESPMEVAAAAAAAADSSNAQHLRKLVMDGDFFLAGTLVAALTKLVISYSEVSSSAEAANKLRAEAMLIMASLLRIPSSKLNDDAFDRIYGCINLLVQGTSEGQQAFVTKPHAAFRELQNRKLKEKRKNVASATEQAATQLEEQIQFRLFSKLEGQSYSNQRRNKLKAFSGQYTVSNLNQSQLKQVTQLTGYSDPVYAEALMTVSQFDINLDVMIFNQTRETLENLKVELYATGELKIVDSPPAVNVAPMNFHTCRVTVRVSSVDAATIFGSIAYESKKVSNVVLLNDIKLNVIDYIRPETCSETDFRVMWVKFEWENKVPVQNNTAKSLTKYLEIFLKHTNMACLSEVAAEDEDARFLSANLYAKSCFGDPVLANLSIELLPDGSITGHVRVRAKQKGTAVSVGDCALTV